jgi:hypothetical protein
MPNNAKYILQVKAEAKAIAEIDIVRMRKPHLLGRARICLCAVTISKKAKKSNINYTT